MLVVRPTACRHPKEEGANFSINIHWPQPLRGHVVQQDVNLVRVLVEAVVNFGRLYQVPDIRHALRVLAEHGQRTTAP
jgi:hypothetical protein